MGLKTLVKLLGVLVVIGLVVLIGKCASSKRGVTTVQSSSEKRKVFENFPINEVETVEIVEKDATVTLKRGENTWEVAERDNYPADPKKVIELIQHVWDLDIGQPVPLTRGQFGRVKLSDPKDDATPGDEAATILRLTGAEGRELGSIWLGKVHETSDGRPNPFGGGMMMSDAGRYVKRGGSNAVLIVEQTFQDAEADPSGWLDDSFFSVSKIQSISRKTGNPEDDWKLTRDEITADFVLADAKEGEELDQTKVTSMKSAFSSPRFEDVLVGEEAEVPDHSVFTVETFDGFTYEVAAGEKSDLNDLSLTVKVSGNFPEKREEGEEETDEEKKRKDEEFAAELKEKKEKLAREKKLEGRVFKVRSFVVDSISKTRSEILAEKKEEEETDTETEPAPPAPAPAPPEKPKAKAEPKGDSAKGGKGKAETPGAGEESGATPKGGDAKGKAEGAKGKGN